MPASCQLAFEQCSVRQPLGSLPGTRRRLRAEAASGVWEIDEPLRDGHPMQAREFPSAVPPSRGAGPHRAAPAGSRPADAVTFSGPESTLLATRVALFPYPALATSMCQRQTSPCGRCGQDRPYHRRLFRDRRGHLSSACRCRGHGDSSGANQGQAWGIGRTNPWTGGPSLRLSWRPLSCGPDAGPGHPNPGGTSPHRRGDFQRRQVHPAAYRRCVGAERCGALVGRQFLQSSGAHHGVPAAHARTRRRADHQRINGIGPTARCAQVVGVSGQQSRIRCLVAKYRLRAASAKDLHLVDLHAVGPHPNDRPQWNLRPDSRPHALGGRPGHCPRCGQTRRSHRTLVVVVVRACHALLRNPRQPHADGLGPPTQPLRHRRVHCCHSSCTSRLEPHRPPRCSSRWGHPASSVDAALSRFFLVHLGRVERATVPRRGRRGRSASTSHLLPAGKTRGTDGPGVGS